MKIKILNSLLLLTMLVNLLSFTVIAEDDIIGTKFEYEVRVLAALGIMGGYEDGSFRSDSPISRAEYADVIARIISESGEEKGVFDAYFSDVPSNYWAAGSIYMLADMGYIKKSNQFKPEEAETYYSAVRTLVNLLGYGDYANANGGYPYGYITTASALGLLDGVTSTTDDVGITRGNVARLVHNALEVDFYHSDVLDIDETILSRRNIITDTGILVATETAALKGYSEAGVGNAIIEDSDGYLHSVKLNGFDAEALLGKKGRFYINEEDEVLIYFFGKISSDELYIGAEEIDNVEGNTIYYKRGNGIKKETVSESVTLILNGERITTDNPGAYLWPECGSVRLSKSSLSSKYDIVYVESYEVYIADKVVANEGKILFKPGRGDVSYIRIEEYDDAKIIRDGKDATLSDIKEWDVVHVAEKSNHMQIVINAVSTNTVTGVVSSMGEDVITIGDNEYRIDYFGYESGYYTAIEMGVATIFYYNMNGEIFAWKKDAAIAGTYGYLKNIRISDEEMKAYSTIYTLDGNFLSYQYADRVSVNGTKFEAEDLIYANDIHDGEKAIDQLVKYKTGEDGKITKIETAQRLEDSKYKENGYDDSQFTIVLENDLAKSQIMTIDHFNSGKFNDTYSADGKTKVMIVPDDLSEDLFDITTVKEAFTSNSKYRDNKPLNIGEVYLYNADRYLVVPLVVCKVSRRNLYSSDFIEFNTSIMLVDKAVKTVNSDDDVVTVISGIYNGKRVSYEIQDNVNFDSNDVKRGVALQIKIDKENKISAIRKVLDIGDGKDVYVESLSNTVGKNEMASWIADLFVYCGNVIDKNKDGTNIVVNTGYDWDHARNFYSKNAKVYKYNLTSKTAEIGTHNDLICSRNNPQKVYLRVYRSLVKEIIIIEE